LRHIVTQVKGGGHQGAKYSSTTGVLIAMTRFSQVTYHEESQTAEVGAGLLCQDAYAALKPHGVTVLGGRVSGVGMGGFILGGGT
jgi:FAD/FMN-containing dehydrogenase